MADQPRRQKFVHPKPSPTLSFSPGNVWRPSGRRLPHFIRARLRDQAPRPAHSHPLLRPGPSAARSDVILTPSDADQSTVHCARRACSPHTTMAPTAPASTGVGSPAAALVAKGYSYSKAAARSVRLGLPALPGLRLAAQQGQMTRAASSCCECGTIDVA